MSSIHPPSNRVNNKPEIFHDVRTTRKGKKKERPWREKKRRGLIVSESFKRLGFEKKAGRIHDCGTFLEFKQEVETGKFHLSAANFCRERLCPLCQWQKSLKIFCEVSQVMDAAQAGHKNLVPLFLTLTLKNVPDGELSRTLDGVFDGWKRFINHRAVKKILKGWFRALELTWNREEETHHPHLHAIILVDRKSYFKKHYLETKDWVHIWRVSLNLDYDPVCDIRKISNSGKKKDISEVAKYTLKDSEFAAENDALTDRLVGVYDKALRNRRLYAFGGVMKQIARVITTASGLAGE